VRIRILLYPVDERPNQKTNHLVTHNLLFSSYLIKGFVSSIASPPFLENPVVLCLRNKFMPVALRDS